MQVVKAMPKKSGGRASKPMYDELARLVLAGKIVRLEEDEIGKPTQDSQYKAQLIRFAMHNRDIPVAVVRHDGGVYVRKLTKAEAAAREASNNGRSKVVQDRLAEVTAL